MRSLSTEKNTPNPKDWDKDDINYALRKKANTNLSKLAKDNGYSRSTLRNALVRPYPKAEKIIAGTIGIEPSEIWPSRYKQTLSVTI